MPQPNAMLDDLFDRPYRPGAVFGPRIGPLRRWGMLALLVLLVGVICGYWFVTDSERVRQKAEAYLARLTGRPVLVKSATLSIFEGLRLDGVSISADGSGSEQSAVFQAQTVLIRYDPQSLFSGRLEATQIVVLDPHVFLCENLDEKRWNFQPRVGGAPAQPGKTPPPPPRFPEILLRNVRIICYQIRNGKVQNQRGFVEIEGNIRPEQDQTLSFAFQSRGTIALGPDISGTINPRTLALDARLRNFTFGEDIWVMLPEQVRAWCKAHQLAGALDVSDCQFAKGDQFSVHATLRDVKLNLLPEELLSGEEGQRLANMRHAMVMMRSVGMDATGAVTWIEEAFNPTPIELTGVNGSFVFTRQRVSITDLEGRVEGNRLVINGDIHGYQVQSAMNLNVKAPEIVIPAAPRYLDSLPHAVRDIFTRLKPSGDAALTMHLERAVIGAKPKVQGAVHVKNGSITLDDFPYPLRAVRGDIEFGPDKNTGKDRLDIIGMRGLGVLGSDNEKVPVNISGFVAPLGDDSQVDITVTANGVTSDRVLKASFPRHIREALAVLDAPGKGDYPEFKGDFSIKIKRPLGPRQKWTTDVDADVHDVKGILAFFPYPIEKLSGHLRIEAEKTILSNLRFRHAEGDIEVDGSVGYGFHKPTRPDIRIRTRNLPIDRDLLSALPPTARAWLEQLGITGQIDVAGSVKRDPNSPDAQDPRKMPVVYDLGIELKNGTVWPGDKGDYAVTQLAGSLHLRPGQITLSQLSGRRKDAAITGGGLISWAGDHPHVAISARAKALLLDKALYNFLPESWRKGWDQAKPEGTVDAELSYTGRMTGSSPSTAPTSQPVEKHESGFSATLTPVQLAATPRILPTRLEDIKGQVLIRPDGVTLRNLTATRKAGGTLAFSGTIATEGRSMWDMKLSGQELVVDKDFKAAVPASVSKLIEGLELKGKIDVSFDKLTYLPASSPKSDDDELALGVTITLPGNSFSIGMPVTDASGKVILRGQSRKGRLAGMSGAIEFAAIKLAGREVTNLRAELIKPDAADALRIGKVAGEIAGGALAGQIDLVFPEKGNSRFGLALLLRNADVKALTGAVDQDMDIKGQLTASLALEGTWGDPNTRRGRGDVQVVGKEMYKIPLVLGLVQITNLSLPISSPFNEAAVRYTVEGNRVGFETIELRASNILMSGSGWLDYGTRKVKMTFVTDNPHAWKIPFLHELIQGARQELLQIHVSGTVQEPKVRGAMMSTFTTTVDEVLKERSRK